MTNRTVAVKVLNYNFTRDQNNVTRFFQEIRALAKLSHGNIVILYDAGKVKRRYFFAMEMVNGPSVQEFVEAKKVLPEKQALAIVRDAAKALGHAHTKNIVHRDIKPENVLLDENSCAKVTDFGVVMHQDADHMTLTKTGFMVGSVFYASPEQVNGLRDIDGRSDIYSLGAMLYYMITGRTVYSGKTPQEVLTKHLSATWVSPRRYNRSLSRSTVRLVRKMMARDRAKRYQSMAEVIAAIDGRGVYQRFLRAVWLVAAALALAGFGMAFERVTHFLEAPAMHIITDDTSDADR
jgi:serine/threonine-protein kinase